MKRADVADETERAKGNLLAALDPCEVFGRSNLVPDPWQARVLRGRARRSLLLCSRQSGKTEVAAASALHEALFHAPSLVLVFSPSLRQSSEFLRRLRGLFAPFASAFPVRREAVLALEFQNGSRVLSLPGDEATVRGYSAASVVILDEAARVPESLYYSVRPMLAVTQGRLVALSTPAGKRGWFYDEWTNGKGWNKTLVKATDCPRISASHLREEEATLGQSHYAQEYLCEFLNVESTSELASAPFGADVLRAMFESHDVRPLFEN